jgi:lactoylglutathione lyase
MTDKHLSRRRVLQIASVVTVPSLLLGSDHASVAAEATSNNQPSQSNSEITKDSAMNLGAFSVSLTVKDLEASKNFYEKLGFKAFAGNAAQNWLVLRNGEHVIGLFQGMFDKNILTFNPGWDQNAKKLDSFTDVRELQRQLKSQGVKLTTEADEKTKGPASFTLEDPDGNQILFDQHV